MFLGLVPLLVGVYVMIMTMPLAIHVSSAGPFRQPEKITHVIRAAKTRQAVKLLMTLYELRSQLSKASSGDGEGAKNVSGEEMDAAIKNLDPQKYASLKKAFDNYDDDGSGEIESSELIALMASLGNHLDEVQVSMSSSPTLDWLLPQFDYSWLPGSSINEGHGCRRGRDSVQAGVSSLACMQCRRVFR